MSLTERIHCDHDLVKHLGSWTAASRFSVKARHGAAVLDLRSPGLPGDIEIHVDMDRAMVKLLVDDSTAIDHWNLRWTARGKIKDSRPQSSSTGDKETGRRIHLSGSATNSEIRIHRGGIAILSAMFSRAYVQDVGRANKTGGVPTIDDPTRGHQS
ncbi:hypothetical protein [Streptomyces sp. NBC_01445]|uniref:hypothetical protein n=1 Tax=Streptomyces sp. NBC_01445 TaxID=2903869 RepID=UPI002DD9EA40|nr:hypothetical protein [Streptomyces sp. NBC_01445]WSE02148.1 hypothetical protein OG574_01160 [Streptomyces sp. NBC_01445]